MYPRLRSLVVVAVALVAAACSAHEAPPSSPPPVAVTRTHAPYTQADVAFMQGMIHHHGQALEMTDLVPTRSDHVTLRVLAERITASQREEIDRMSRWLRARGETVPAPGSYREHVAHGMRMPGMLSLEEMQGLAAATGREFDRRFLELMIRHHEGALVMVGELQAAGGGLEAEIYTFASDVDADQRAEIARMQSMLTALQRGSDEIRVEAGLPIVLLIGACSGAPATEAPAPQTARDDDARAAGSTRSARRPARRLERCRHARSATWS